MVWESEARIAELRDRIRYLKARLVALAAIAGFSAGVVAGILLAQVL